MGEQASLRVERDKLLEGFRFLKKLAKPSPGEQAVFSFDGATLYIDVAGMGISAPAQGSWSGQARVNAIWVLCLAKAPPPGDPIILSVADGRIHLQTSSYACAWQGAWQSLIQLADSPDTATLMAVKLKYTEEQIRESGLEEPVAKATMLYGADVAAAAKLLKMYGVKEADLHTLVVKAIRESGLTAKV